MSSSMRDAGHRLTILVRTSVIQTSGSTALSLQVSTSEANPRPVLGAEVVAGEEGILAVERQAADRALDRVGIDLDVAVVEEAGEAIPVIEPVGERLADLAAFRHSREALLEPGLQRFDDGLGAALARTPTQFG